MHSRARRRFSRGLKRKPLALIKKLRKAKKEAPPLEKPAIVKTHLRNMIVVPEMVGSIIGIYNGKTFNQVSNQIHRINTKFMSAIDTLFVKWYAQFVALELQIAYFISFYYSSIMMILRWRDLSLHRLNRLPIVLFVFFKFYYQLSCSHTMLMKRLSGRLNTEIIKKIFL